jgi:hypothetical protein
MTRNEPFLTLGDKIFNDQKYMQKVKWKRSISIFMAHLNLQQTRNVDSTLMFYSRQSPLRIKLQIHGQSAWLQAPAKGSNPGCVQASLKNLFVLQAVNSPTLSMEPSTKQLPYPVSSTESHNLFSHYR